MSTVTAGRDVRVSPEVRRRPSLPTKIRELITAPATGSGLAAPPPDSPGPFTLAGPKAIHEVLTEAGYHEITSRR